MVYADLHIHSSYSDGNLTPKEIIDQSIEKGIKYISITDHDSITGQNIINQRRKEIGIIPGIELSSRYNELEIHILGYFININSKNLIDALDKITNARIQRAEEILYKLRKYNIVIDINEILINQNVSIGRGNIAKIMLQKGYVSSYTEAFSRYLAKDRLAYVHGEKLSTKEAIKLIEGAGGIPVLAHPGKIYKGLELEKIIRQFKAYGLKGIEVYHPGHTRDKINYLYNISKKNRMIITGGSDYHGEERKKISLGCQGINEELLNILTNKGELNEYE